MSARPALLSPDACRRVSALAQGLGRDLQHLPANEASGYSRAKARAILGRVDEMLNIGLGFDVEADPELAYRRGHARNVALVLRRTVEAALAGSASASGRNELLSQAVRFAEDLSGTVMWIRQHLLELPAATAPRPWSSTWTGRVLAVAARLLPAERRQDFIEDQCGNLASVESRREWVGYLLGLLTHMPRVAAAAFHADTTR